MSQKSFSFGPQVNIGNQGEQDFISFYSKLQPTKSKDRAIDFFLKNGKTVELKTDTYSMERTPNFFLETLSSIDSGKLGGPMRSKQDGVNFFVYYYRSDKTFFWFETEKLCERFQQLIDSGKFQIKNIGNKTGKNTWTAQGYAMPREAFEDILYRKDVFA